MNKIFLIVVAFLCATNISIAQTKTPKAVETAFKAKFPTAQAVKWDKENSNEYEAGFTIDGQKCSANFDAKGNWLETEETIDQTTLPQTVLDAIQKQFKDWKLNGAAKITNSKGEI